jgi:hypothetical protein
MKNFNMRGILAITISMAAFAFAGGSILGQETTNAPTVEHFKVENGLVWILRPYQGAVAINSHTGAPEPSTPKDEWLELGTATVGNAVRALGILYPTSSIAVDPNVAKESIPDIVIRAKDLLTNLELLRTACGTAFEVEPLKDAAFALTPSPTWVHSKPDRAVQCFNLAGYLMGKTDNKSDKTNDAVTKLEDMIDLTLEKFDPSISRPQYRFYEDGPLFIVIGSQQTIDIAGKIIRASDPLTALQPKP